MTRQTFNPLDWPMAHFAQLESQHQRNVNRLLEPYGLKHREWRILAFIDGAQSTGVTELAQAAVIERSTIGKLLTRLKDRGFVVDARSQGDARVNPVRLTAKGRSLIKRTAAMVEALFEQYHGSLSAQEHAELMRLLWRYRLAVFAISDGGATAGASRRDE